MIGAFKNPAKGNFDEHLASNVRPTTTQQGVIDDLQSDVLSLQRAVGNRAVSSLVHTADNWGGGLQGVRLHSGKTADQRTELEGAIACASGRDVYLGNGVDLRTGFGQRVLAHELTHVIQQERGRAGVPQASQASLEGEATYASGVGTAAAMDVGGASAPGSVQKLERQGIPSSVDEQKRWDIEIDADAQRLTDILSSAFYSYDDETEVIAILNRWATRQSESERKTSVEEASSLDPGIRRKDDTGIHFGIRSDFLDRLFDRLRATRIWTRYGRTTAYQAMFEQFERAQEVRTIRDTYSSKYVGREEEADKAREERNQEDLLGENLFGWRTNRFESAPSATSPPDKARAAWVIRRLAELHPDQLTPRTRLLSEGVAREGQDFLLKRTHVVTAGDKLRFIKGVARGAVVMMLEFAVWELGLAAAEAVVPDLLAGVGGAEAAGTEGAVAKEGEIAAQTGAPEALGENVTSIVGRPRTGTIEGLKGEGQVLDFPGAGSKRPPEPTPPTPASQFGRAANDNVEGGLANESQQELGWKKAANAGGETAEPTESMAGKTASKPLYGLPKSPSISAEISGEATPLEGSLGAPKTKGIPSESGLTEHEASQLQPVDENVVPPSERFDPPPAVPEPTEFRQATKTIGRERKIPSVSETIPETEAQTVSVTSVEAPEAIAGESTGATEQSGGDIANVEEAPSSRTAALSPEEIQHKIKTRQANEKTIRRLERQLKNTESRGAQRNPENVKRQIYELRAENEQLIEEVTSTAPARPGEPLRDLEHRWFKQRQGEPLNVYRERIAAKREMVEEEALRHESRLELLDRYDELVRSLERRSEDLIKAEAEGEAAARKYAELRREWWSAKKTASDAGEAFPRKSSKELFERDLQLDDDYQTARRRLNEAEREIRRAQFGITNTGDIAEKSIARDYLLDSGFENIRSVQNRSGHGIDIVATRKSDGKTIFFEVKGSETSRAGRLSERQKDATAFVTGSVEDLSPKDQQELLAQIGSGKVEGYVLEITDINLLARQGKVNIRPW
jgi:hypothetical protein